ncbi:MAG: hypothetical protein EA376_04130 [Phycisphaeraceae bacterium]|nr:MAG: hypothetical protein EA376_04130 [Phycisphaeraceae bacterium]
MSGDGRPVVCFDLGGVVVRICRSWEEGCAAAGIEVREIERYRETHPERVKLVQTLDTGGIEPDAFYRAISDTLDGVYTPEEVRQVHHAWLLGEYPGVEELLTDLRERDGVRTACLSNTNHDHWVAMESYPTLQALEHRHASHLLGLRKPNESCFIAFERAMEASPGQIIFFDDTEENIEAARARGWRAELIDHTGDTAAQVMEHLRGVVV